MGLQVARRHRISVSLWIYWDCIDTVGMGDIALCYLGAGELAFLDILALNLYPSDEFDTGCQLGVWVHGVRGLGPTGKAVYAGFGRLWKLRFSGCKVVLGDMRETLYRNLAQASSPWAAHGRIVSPILPCSPGSSHKALCRNRH